VCDLVSIALGTNLVAHDMPDNWVTHYNFKPKGSMSKKTMKETKEFENMCRSAAHAIQFPNSKFIMSVVDTLFHRVWLDDGVDDIV